MLIRNYTLQTIIFLCKLKESFFLSAAIIETIYNDL